MSTRLSEQMRAVVDAGGPRLLGLPETPKAMLLFAQEVQAAVSAIEWRYTEKPIIAMLERRVERHESTIARLRDELWEAQTREAEARSKADRIERENREMRRNLMLALARPTPPVPAPSPRTVSRKTTPVMSCGALAIFERPEPDPIGLAEERRIAEEIAEAYP